MDPTTTRTIAGELVELLGTAQQIPPFSQRYPEFGIAEAYDVVSLVRTMRSAGGETPVGRKIGFTNRAIWDAFAITAPIWNFMFDRNVHSSGGNHSTFRLPVLPEPRIEPELVLHLCAKPEPGMDETDLLACVDWIAAGFEIVFSVFPGWKFSAADAAAAYGVHHALFIGPELRVSENRAGAGKALTSFTVELSSDAGEARSGHATDVLGGPLSALKFLVEEIARHPASDPLRPGEVITTGTLTEAMPAVAGVTWTSRFSGINLGPLSLQIA
jgi:2-oxo-3-hexenedioate decarboxylase